MSLDPTGVHHPPRPPPNKKKDPSLRPGPAPRPPGGSCGSGQGPFCRFCFYRYPALELLGSASLSCCVLRSVSSHRLSLGFYECREAREVAGASRPQISVLVGWTLIVTALILSLRLFSRGPNKSDLRSHCAIVQPRLYDSAMVTLITLKTEGPHGLPSGRRAEADPLYPGLIILTDFDCGHAFQSLPRECASARAHRLVREAGGSNVTSHRAWPGTTYQALQAFP